MPKPKPHDAPRASEKRRASRASPYLGLALVVLAAAAGFAALEYRSATRYARAVLDPPPPAWPPPLDTKAYDLRMLSLAHVNAASTTYGLPPSVAASSTLVAGLLAASTTATTSVSVAGSLWPAGAPYPYGGALLPFNRIVAYYGNFYSAQMGVLGQYPPDEVLAMLASTTAQWAAADPATPVVPAIQYIAVVAQGAPGADGTWRARMPDSEIDQALGMANRINGLLILDVQVGQSTLQDELPPLARYLQMPNVELAIDPEFSMKNGAIPDRVIGTFTAGDVNFAASYLASIVDQYHLPPKVLVVHRFTYGMVPDAQDIRPLPEVQVVMDMDGWGEPAKKFNTYNRVIAPYPVEFTGIKLFYKNDLLPPSTRLLTPAEVLSLTPSPIYIQYQ